jgi:cytochrome c biogenesis protein CcmG, thiol:disulfide interchange protein DsbE
VSQTNGRGSKTRRALLVSLGIVVGLAAGLLILTGLDPSWLPIRIGAVPKADPAVPETNAPALNFSLESLSGEKVTLSDFKGQVVLINYWATWCIPCKAEMPLLQRYADRYQKDLVVLAVNDGEPVELITPFVQELNLTLPVLLDPNETVTQQYRIRGFPTTIFVDQDGKIRYQHIGILNEEQLKGYLAELGIKE